MRQVSFKFKKQAKEKNDQGFKLASSLFFFADSRYLPGSKDGKKSKSSKSGKAKGLAFTLLHRLEMDIQIMNFIKNL